MSGAKQDWIDRFGPAADQAWSRLQESGITLEQAAGWQPDGCPAADYLRWLADYLPYAGPVDDPGPDPIAWLLDEARRRALLWAALDHSRLFGPDVYNEEEETRHCLEQLWPSLEQALAAGDPLLIDAAARRAIAGHTFYRDYKNYRYHLDTCAVSQLGRLILGVAAFPSDPSAAADLLIGDRDRFGDGEFEQVRYPSPVCMTAWLALTFRVGRLVEDEPLRTIWEASSKSGEDGRWMLRMTLEGFLR